MLPSLLKALAVIGSVDFCMAFRRCFESCDIHARASATLATDLESNMLSCHHLVPEVVSSIRARGDERPVHGVKSNRIDCVYVIAISMALEGEVFALLIVLHVLDRYSALDGADHVALTIRKAGDTPAGTSSCQHMLTAHVMVCLAGPSSGLTASGT